MWISQVSSQYSHEITLILNSLSFSKVFYHSTCRTETFCLWPKETRITEENYIYPLLSVSMRKEDLFLSLFLLKKTKRWTQCYRSCLLWKKNNYINLIEGVRNVLGNSRNSEVVKVWHIAAAEPALFVCWFNVPAGFLSILCQKSQLLFAKLARVCFVDICPCFTSVFK